MSDQRRHQKYRDSGVEWLGDVPSHWDVSPIKFVASYNDEVLDESTDSSTEITYIEISDVSEYAGVQLNSPIRFGSAPSRARRVVRKGDVLVSTVRTYLRAIAAVERDCDNLIASTGFAVLRAKTIDPEYLRFAMLTEYVIDEVISRSVGVSYPAINSSDLVRVKIPVPPLAEQRAIASYLDRETSEIDSFISDQKELITLLNERRAATITQAVTKGLDLNVQMNDSGVPWIGKVPQHWVVDKGTRIGKVFGSEMIKEEDINEVSGTQFLKVSSLSVEGFSLQPTRWFVDRYAAAPVTDFIVFPKRGAAIFTNKVNIVKEPALLDPNLMGWKPYAGCDSKFFAYVLQLVKLEEIADVSTVPQINTKHIASLRLPKPSLAEQQRIVDYLDHETNEIDAAISDAKEAIELSKERRAALISAAVTGKIDVRNHFTAELGAA